ncbi:CHAT domain protein [Rhizoctonia solani 123E]|uniref:CHAT domain protein n=1 Tax=Rhizoctonia solani 123E TaxID=1423351 RepID=A0A074SGN7_9AGAM|nr:CHAT domain protein [Rhizoctonia solani 123E]
MELFHLSVATAISLFAPAETIHRILEEWTRYAVMFEHHSALDAYIGQTSVVTQLSWVGFDVQTRYEHLLRISSLAPDASVYACLKNSPALAVEFLETFRSILFSQTLSLRSQQHELRASHPSLASELERIGKAIEMRSFGNRAPLKEFDRFNPDIDRRHHETLDLHTLGEEWDEVVLQIRNVPGYESFLQTPSVESLCQAANNGPVVMIVASEKHEACYAIVIFGPSANDIQSTKLPLTIPKAEELSKRFNTNLFSAHLRKANTGTDYLQHEAGRGVKQKGKVSSECPKLGSYAVLKELWELVMQPVIELVETHSPAFCKDGLLHIWLVVAGILSSLPLHAAGIYEPDGTTVDRCCVLDRVICSYAPSLSALNRKPPSELLSETKLFAFGGGQGLSAASKEVEAVRSICSPKMTVSVASAHATPEGIKKEMQNAHIVHFACHGTQDLANPLRSRLEFSKSSKIEVEELMSEPMPNARLAVLLACETAQGDQRLTEESLHLAGTMLFAGFYGAVGTLWKMEDQDGPIVCEEFYKRLLEEDKEVVQYFKAGEALHRAVRKLKESGAHVLRWASFVHIGR